MASWWPPSGPRIHLAFLWEDHPAEDRVATIEHHAADLEFTLERFRADRGVDAGRIVMLAWSYGGQTAARVQERVDAVRAVIGLDANVVPVRQEESLALRRPLVYFVGRDTTGRGFGRVGELTAPWVTVRLPALEHGNFNAMESYFPARFGADTVFAWSRGGPTGLTGYPAVARMVIELVSVFAGDTAVTPAGLARRLRAVGDTLAIVVRHSGEGAER